MRPIMTPICSVAFYAICLGAYRLLFDAWPTLPINIIIGIVTGVAAGLVMARAGK